MQVARNVQAGNGMEDGALRFCIIRQPGYIVYVPYRHTVCLFINTGIIMMLHTHYFYPAITALHKSVRRYTSYLKVLFLPKKKIKKYRFRSFRFQFRIKGSTRAIIHR